MIKEIFEKNVLKLEGNGNCWIWQDNLSQGYGRLKFCGVLVLAHRFAYELYNNAPVDQSYGVLHKCHNKQCVNPEHLYLGSAQENSRDWIESRKKDIVSNPVELKKIQQVEKELIVNALKNNLNSRAEVSRQLGISSTTLWRKMKKYGI